MQPKFQCLAMVRLNNARIQIDLTSRPVLVAAPNDVAEDMLPRRAVGVYPSWLRFQDLERRLRQRDEVLASAFGARGRQGDQRQRGGELLKEKPSNLVAART